MGLIGLITTLVIIGLILYLVSLLPIDDTIKKIIHVIVIVVIILYLLQSVGVLGSGDLRIGR